MHRKLFREILDGLAGALNLPGISTSEDGCTALIEVDGFELCLRCIPQGFVVLFAVVAPFPVKNKAEVARELLDANTLYYRTQGFTLGARKDTGVTLQGVISLRVVDQNSIRTFVENFLNVAEYWQEFCQSKGGGQEAAHMPDELLNMLSMSV